MKLCNNQKCEDGFVVAGRTVSFDGRPGNVVKPCGACRLLAAKFFMDEEENDETGSQLH